MITIKNYIILCTWTNRDEQYIANVPYLNAIICCCYGNQITVMRIGKTDYRLCTLDCRNGSLRYYNNNYTGHVTLSFEP